VRARALQAALRKDDAVLGIITIYRQEVRPYTENVAAANRNRRRAQSYQSFDFRICRRC
jgi:hypothetical protein